MLEKLPSLLGRGLRKVRPGLDRIVSAHAGIARAPLTIELTSPAFADQDSIPRRFTADARDARHSSPPLHWRGVPAEAQTLILIVEDADSPTPRPLVHGIVTGLPATASELAEDDLATGSGLALGKNSYFTQGWLPPDPPPGHGVHRYVFQLLALDHVPEIGAKPGRSAVLEAAAGHTIARGMLIGTYMR